MDYGDLLPRLRHRDWYGWTDVLGRDLLDPRLPGGVPRVGVGVDTPAKFWWAEADGRELAALEPIALANLARRPARWEVVDKDGGFLGRGGRPAVLKLVDEYASERLLDRAFLDEAHQLLRAPMVALVTPVRGMLYAASALDPERVATLRANATVTFGATTLEPLSPQVFVVQSGAVTGVAASALLDAVDMPPTNGFPWPTRVRHADLEQDDAALLRVTGYHEASQQLVLSCYLALGAQLRGPEVTRLARLAGATQMPDGRPLAATRVLFPDHEMATRARPMLAATGASIAFLDPRGEIRTLD